MAMGMKKIHRIEKELAIVSRMRRTTTLHSTSIV